MDYFGIQLDCRVFAWRDDLLIQDGEGSRSRESETEPEEETRTRRDRLTGAASGE